MAEPLDLSYTANALKPFRPNFKAALALLAEQGVAPNQVVMIGDQVMTDVVGANRMGLPCILVKPIAKHDNIYTWLNRTLERQAMRWVGIDRLGDWGQTLDD